MIVAVTGAGGGVGTSTVGLLLSVALSEGADPDREVILVEADRGGGVAGARYDIGIGSGLQAWAAGLATDPGTAVTSFGKRITEGLRVMAGPPAPADAERVLAPAVSAMLATAMRADDSGLWVVDVGRGGSASAVILDAADCVVIVALGLPEQIVRLPSLVTAASPIPCIVMVGGQSSWSVTEIKHHCGALVVIDGPDSRIPADHVVDLVEGRKRRRSIVWRSVLRCRDAVVESGATSAEQPSPTVPIVGQRSTG